MNILPFWSYWRGLPQKIEHIYVPLRLFLPLGSPSTPPSTTRQLPLYRTYILLDSTQRITAYPHISKEGKGFPKEISDPGTRNATVSYQKKFSIQIGTVLTEFHTATHSQARYQLVIGWSRPALVEASQRKQFLIYLYILYSPYENLSQTNQTRRYSQLCGPPSSYCRGLRPLPRFFFLLLAKKSFLYCFGQF